MNPALDNRYPKSAKTTRYRIIGPELMNGMNTWRIVNLRNNKQEGPRCLSMDEVVKRAANLVKGKRTFWFGGVPFEAKKID